MPEIISRAEAKAHGLGRYFTGNPCVQGHVSWRKTCDGGCSECRRMRDRLRRPVRNRERVCPHCDQIFIAKPGRGYSKRIYCYSAICTKFSKKTKTPRDVNRENALRRLRHPKWYEKNKGKHAVRVRKYYLNGPHNPKGEKQWLRKNQAQLRSVKRLLRSLSHGLPPSPSSAFTTPTGSRK